jgi:hypothetical protein
MLYIDLKYLKFLSPQLDRFTQKEPRLYNCRCPLCGDSKKNKYKARGFFFVEGESLLYKCHNCGASMKFSTLLKLLSPSLHQEYIMERFRPQKKEEEPDFSDMFDQPAFDIEVTDKINATSIEELPEEHYVKRYIRDRQIPREHWSRLYFTPDFMAFVNETFPNNEKALRPNEPRIIIPFYNKDGVMQGIQGRAADPHNKVRYITIKKSKEATKLFGWERVDPSRTVYVVEGPFDSLFLDNGVAMMDSILYHAPDLMGEHDFVFVFDNEPRNKQIVKTMVDTINRGYKICIWPQSVQCKDINDMVKEGTPPAFVQHMIDKNTYQGMNATLMLNTWRKI